MHALALGFVFSMVFGHAPIIVPAVLRVAVPYSPAFYAPLALLHLSLLVRIAGDATGAFDWTRAGGLLNAHRARRVHREHGGRGDTGAR